MNRLVIHFPVLDAELQRRLAPVARDLGEEVAAFLREKLSGAGGGHHWPGLPNPSSAPGEYPAEQTGALLACLGSREVDPLYHQAGALNSVAPVPIEAWELEYPSPPGTPSPRSASHGARPWITKAFMDEELRERLRAVPGRHGLNAR